MTPLAHALALLLALSASDAPAAGGLARDTIRVDLARSSVDAVTETVAPGTNYAVVVENLIPDKSRYTYTVRVIVEAIPIDGLVWEKTPSTSTPPDPGITSSGECTEALAGFRSTYDAVYAAASETAVRDRLRALYDAQRAVRAVDGCDVPPKNHAAALKDTRAVFGGPYALRRGERLTVVVTRRAADGTETTWRHVAETAPRGRWVTSYGPALMLEGGPFDEPTYVAEQQPADAEGTVRYLLREQADRRWLSPSAALFFTWLPNGTAARTWTGSGFVGLNTDGRFSLGGSGTFAFNENLLAHVGVGLHSVETLLGRYLRPDQRADGEDGAVEVEGNLSFDQLHDPEYRVVPFVALTFRFGSAPPPFGGGAGE